MRRAGIEPTPSTVTVVTFRLALPLSYLRPFSLGESVKESSGMEEKPRRSSLCLTLKPGESIDIGDDVSVVFKGRKPGTGNIRFSVTAPVTTKIRRKKAEKSEVVTEDEPEDSEG